MKECRVKDICIKGSSNLKQKDVEGKKGLYPVYGASGIISSIDTYHQENEYIAIVKDGSGIGRVSFMPPKSSVIGTMQYILPKEGYDIRYIGYCLQSLGLNKYKQGAAIPHIYFRDYGERNIIVTDNINEQRRIVSYLDSSLKLIDEIKNKALKSLTEAKALFQSALAEAMEPKEGWEYKKIYEVGQVVGGTTPNTNNPNYWNGDLCWISPAELTGNHYLYDSRKKITQEAVNSKSLKLLPVGTVILSSRAPIGKVTINKVPTYCNQGFKCVICKNSLYNEYLYWWFYGHTKFLNSLGTGATFAEISKKVVENIIIPIPSIDEQSQIVSHLDKLSSKVRAIEEKYQKMVEECDALKQAMLRDVFE